MKKYAKSTLMGYTKKSLVVIIRCLEHNIEVLEERNSNQFNLLMQAYKYAWHDLRKNPEDLPKENGKYLCIYSFEGCVMTDNIVVEVFMDGIWGTPDEFPIIAWKKIEPFEEVEE